MKMERMQVSIDLTDSYFSLYDEKTLIQEIQLGFALFLFRQGKISIGKAAQIARLDIYEFMKECSKQQIPIINLTEEDIQKEWNELQEDFL